MTFVSLKNFQKTLGYVHFYNWNKSFTHLEHLARVVGREAVRNFGNNGNNCRFHIAAFEFGADELQCLQLSERVPQLHIRVLTKTHHYIFYIHELKINL